MTSEYYREFTPPAPPVVKLTCRLVVHRSSDERACGDYTGPPTPDDIRGWLDAQTEEYRAEVIVGVLRQITLTEIRALLKASAPQDFESAEDVQRERDSLKSQLSAAIAERDTARVELQSMAECRDAWQKLAKERGKALADALDKNEPQAAELNSARETIRKLETELDESVSRESDNEQWLGDARRDLAYTCETIRSLEQLNANQASEIRKARELKVADVETIRALTEERDFFDAERIKVVEALTTLEQREAPGEEWKRAQDSTHAKLKRLGVPAWLDQCMTPYEPPRSEEGRPDEVDQIRKELNVEALDAQGARLGLHGTTRLAPLTDREIVPRESVRWFAEKMELTLRKNDSKGGWSQCTNAYLLERAEQELTELHMAVGDRKRGVDSREQFDLVVSEATDVANFVMMLVDNARRQPHYTGAAIDLPKTPDVLTSRYSQQTKDAHGAVILAGLSGTPEELHSALRELGTMVHCDLAGELREPHSLKTPDVRREDYHDQRIAEAGYVPASERDELREKLRLATEQVEALKKCHDAASRCASIIRDLRVPSVALTNEMVNAFAEYENWLKPTGAK